MFVHVLIALLLLQATPAATPNITPLTDDADWIGPPALSPDGKTLAFDWLGPDSSLGIFLRPVEGGQPVIFVAWDEKKGAPDSPAWSPDGKQIAFLRESCAQCSKQLSVKGYPNAEERSLGDACSGPPSWTPDGRFLIAAEPEKDRDGCHLALIPVDGGSRIKLLPDGDLAAVSRDGKRLAYAAGNIVKLANLTADFRIAGAPVTLAMEPHEIATLHWLPSGQELFYQVSDATYYSKLISAERAPSAARLVNAGGNVQVSEILADGSMLGAETGGQSALWRIDLQSAEKKPERVRSLPWTDRLVHVSPDGQWIAFATNRSGPAQVWISRLDGSRPRIQVPSIPPFNAYGDPTGVAGISWSPDGKWIALMTEPGVRPGVDEARLFLVPAAGGPPRLLVDRCSVLGDSTPWSADSRSVYVSRVNARYKDKFLPIDILTGKQTAVTDPPVSARDLARLPSGAEQPHLAQAGRFVYFEQRAPAKIRIVSIHNLLKRVPGF